MLTQDEDEEEQFSDTESPTHLRQMLADELGADVVMQTERGEGMQTEERGECK